MSSVATTAARDTVRITTGRSRERSVGLDPLPRRAVVLSVLRRDGARRAGRRHAGRRGRAVRRGPDHQLRLHPLPRAHRLPRRHPRQHLADAGDGGARRTAGYRRGPLPRGVRRPRHLVQPADRGEPAEPRRRAVGDLRPAGGRGDGGAGVRAQGHRAGRRDRPRPADPPGHHHRHPRVRARRTQRDPIRVARPRRDDLADHVAADPARLRAGHRDRHHPRPLARDR